MMGLLLAHQGGWDEILMFLLPIALVVGTWWLLDRRKSKRAKEGAESGSPPDSA